MTTLQREVLARAEGLQLIGEMQGSGYRVPPSLVRRADGQTLQVTPLLYAILETLDEPRAPATVAQVVSERTGRAISADNVAALADRDLRPLGLLTKADGSQPEVKRADPLLGLRLKAEISDPENTGRITAPFATLFTPLIAVPVLIGFFVLCWWIVLEKGLASATREAFERPGLLLLVFALTVFSAGFHEFGHAAAARYGGATPGAMGAGLYLLWPAFYTDVTDSYRLGRAGRIRTDLGGLYFNALVAVAIAGVWFALRYDALLLVVATQLVQMLRQLAPFVRFDGYHVLADVTGVPDLFHRMKPTLLGVLPWRWGDPEARALKPWARLVVTAWVLTVVPVLLLTFALIVLALPRIVATAWVELGEQARGFAAAIGEPAVLDAGARALMMLAVLLPVASIFYLLFRMARASMRAALRSTEGHPIQRLGVAALAVLLIALVGNAWWPDHSYRPIESWERGTLADGLAAVGFVEPPAASPRLDASAVAVFDLDEALPTRAEPVLALVLLPGEDAPTDAPTWVFPFDEPLAPDPDDNQALAVNTVDGTIVYEAAFALVWADDGAALHANEAYAFASCLRCAAVAIGFQIVLVPPDNHVAIPRNVAAAVNVACVNCLTYALAQQVFVTLDAPLTSDTLDELDALWAQIAAYAERIETGSVPMDEIDGALDAFSEQILELLGADVPDPDTSTEPSPTPSERASAEPSPSPSQSSPSKTPPGSASPSPSASPSVSPPPTASASASQP